MQSKRVFIRSGKMTSDAIIPKIHLAKAFLYAPAKYSPILFIGNSSTCIIYDLILLKTSSFSRYCDMLSATAVIARCTPDSDNPSHCLTIVTDNSVPSSCLLTETEKGLNFRTPIFPIIWSMRPLFIFGAVFVQHFVNCKYHILPIIRKCSLCCFSVRQSTMPHIHNPLPFLNMSYCKLSSCRFIHRLLL